MDLGSQCTILEIVKIIALCHVRLVFLMINYDHLAQNPEGFQNYAADDTT